VRAVRKESNVSSKRTLGIGLAVVAALLTSACAAGQHAHTAEEQSTTNGVSGDLGSLHIRGLVIEAPLGPSYGSGDNAMVKMVIVNVGETDDQLKNISSPAFADWGAFNSTADADAVLSPAPSSSTPDTASSSASPSATHTSRHSSSASSTRSASSSAAASSSATPSPTPSSSSAPLPTPIRQVTIPAGGRASWGVPEAKGALVILGFSGQVFPGTAIQVTLDFAQAGSITLQVPVALSGSPNTSPIPELSTSVEA
jgi:hypothetical protein